MDHTTDAHTPHSHGHDHGHAHSHTHDHGHDHSHGGSDYYLQQLLTVFICGAFGVSGVLMYTLGKLNFILAPAFHLWVLVGSGLLLAAVAFRMVALWRSAGAHANDHDHAHGDDCGHDHKPGEKCDHHGHSHADHSAEDHDHGNIYWRVVVLAFPVAILAMGLPNSSFSKEKEFEMLGKGSAIDTNNLAEVQAKDGEIKSDFDLLASAAYSQPKRDAYTGAKASIVGKMRKLTDKQFTLYKLKITCCSSDAIPLQALAITKSASQMANFGDGEEIEVKGVIQFAPNDKGEYITVLKVDPDGIRRTGK